MKVRAIRKRRPRLKVRIVSPKGVRTMVACGQCGGNSTRIGFCTACMNYGTMPQFRPAAVIRKPRRITINRRWGVRDLERMGFRQTGIVSEPVPEDRLGQILRKWVRASREGVGGQTHWESLLAKAGWWRAPPTWETILTKYPPREEEPQGKPSKTKGRSR